MHARLSPIFSLFLTHLTSGLTYRPNRNPARPLPVSEILLSETTGVTASSRQALTLAHAITHARAERTALIIHISQESDHLLSIFLGTTHAAALRFLKPYFLESFGSFRRLDYGTGHETSFALFLCSLTLLRIVHPQPAEERALVLRVFARYLRLCWRLQDTYKLEPAGSHGVWGLDDYSFLPYMFGSGQLRGTLFPSYRLSISCR